MTELPISFMDNKKLNQLHDEAMAIAEHAFIAKWKGDSETAITHFRRAYELEAEAAQLIAETTVEPLHSVLLRSAASLAYHCNEMQAAETLIATAGNPRRTARFDAVGLGGVARKSGRRLADNRFFSGKGAICRENVAVFVSKNS